jgi:U4/U6.U5 tri-snRNP-associated protein 3
MYEDTQKISTPFCKKEACRTTFLGRKYHKDRHRGSSAWTFVNFDRERPSPPQPRHTLQDSIFAMAEPPAKRPRRERSRSREQAPRDRDHDRDRGTRDRSREREYRRRDGDRDRDTDRSRDKHRPLRGTLYRDIIHELDSHTADHPPSRPERPQRRSRSRSPRRNGEGTSSRIRSPPRPKRDRERDDERPTSSSSAKLPLPSSKAPTKSEPPDTKAKTKMDIDVDEDPEEAMLRKMMGFTSFKTTQNTKVPGNQIYGVRKEKKTEYRQYMNRVGGFNRPLSPSR